MYEAVTVADIFGKHQIFYTEPPRHEIQEVIYNDPATIVKWTDGDKTVVKCHEGDEYDPKLGLLYCIAKKTFGGGRYNDILAKHLPKPKVEVETEVEAKTKFDWDKFRDGKLVVHCKTLEAAQDFLKKCAKSGLNWCNAPADDHSNYGFHGDKTCYRCDHGQLRYCYRRHYEVLDYDIVEWEPKPKTPKFDWEGFKAGKFSVECKTLEAAKKFNRKAKKHGIVPFLEDDIERQVMTDRSVYTICGEMGEYGLWAGKRWIADTVKEYE